MATHVRWQVEACGMPTKVARALDVLEDLWPFHDGPAHIVVADYNLEDGSIRACIASIDRGDTHSSDEIEVGDPVFAATRAVLVWMLENMTEVERTEWLERY